MQPELPAGLTPNSPAGKPGITGTPEGTTPPGSASTPERLAFHRATTISASGETLAVELDSNGSS